MNGIRQKLKMIDAEFTSAWELFLSSLARRPLILPAFGIIAGIALSKYYEIPALWLYVSLLLILATAGLCLKFTDNRKLVLMAVLCLAAAFCTAGLRISISRNIDHNDISRLAAKEKTLAAVRGRIITEPAIQNSQWAFSEFKPYDKRTSFYINVTEAKTDQGFKEMTGKIRVQVNEPVLNLHQGQEIELLCWLEHFKDPSNPAQFDVKRYLKQRGVYLAANVPSRDSITVLDQKNSSLFRSLKYNIRKLVLYNYKEKDTGLLEALLLGTRANIDRQLYNAFRSTGLLHLISLSGLHVGIFIGAIWFLARTAQAGRKIRALICLLSLAVFILLVPPRPATIRAVLIGSVFCVSILVRKNPDPLNTLSLVCIIMLLANPENLFNTGWQLSFACVLGIILFTDRIYFYLNRFSPHKRSSFSAGIANMAVRTLAMGTSAWLASSGIILYKFNSITPLAPLLTVVVMPLLVILLLGGYLNIIAAWLLPTLSSIFSWLLSITAAVFLNIVEFFALIPLSEILLPSPNLYVICIYYIFIYLLFFGFPLRHIKKPISVSLTGSFLVIGLLLPPWHNYIDQSLTVDILDVSHGQAILITSPADENILLDCGSLYLENCGDKIMAPFLRKKGISRLKLAIASHSDIDHINGLPEIFDSFKIEEIMLGPSFQKDDYMSELLIDEIKQSKIKIIHHTTKTGFPDMEFKILWPAGNIDPDLSDNDLSLVLMISYKDKNILFCSDIEKDIQSELLNIYPELNCDVLVAPHHGSAKTVNREFIEHLSPSKIISSCSMYRKKRGEIIDDLADIDFLTTAVNGAIRIKIDKSGQLTSSTYK